MVDSIPELINFNKIGSLNLGYISVGEVQENVPFEIKRVYWTYYTPNHVIRGHHAHIELQQIVIAVSGTIVFDLENENGDKYSFTLDDPDLGLYIPPGYWRTIRFSHNGVLVCFASEKYDEQDYIRDYDNFKKKLKISGEE